MPHLFKATAKHEAVVPLTVTKASSVISAICFRNDTTTFIGQRSWNSMNAPIKPMPKEYVGYVIPVDHDVMAEIIGSELAIEFHASQNNPALVEFYSVLSDKLSNVGITLAFSKEYWFIIKMPTESGKLVNRHYSYTMDDLASQGPDGFRGFKF
jgi:hypothetical protein